MPSARLRASGFGLVEVLVAMAILSLQTMGWTAMLVLIFKLVSRVDQLSTGLDPSAVASAVCGLGLLLPRTVQCNGVPLTVRIRCASPPWLRRRGVSLVEILVALAIGAMVIAGLVATLHATSRTTSEAHRVVDATVVSAVLPGLLREVMESAGRGMPSACGLGGSVGGSRLVVRRALDDGGIVVDELFAGRDSGGRPALYLRRVPHARQPWVEDVTEFVVERIDVDADATTRSVRAERVVVRIAHESLSEMLEIAISLPHQPCIEGPP